MIRFLTALCIALSFPIMFSNCSVENTRNTSRFEEPREDYGCVHDNHSQYDDGDSLNLEAASQNF